MPAFQELPTKEQIAAIDHAPSLEAIRDDIDRAVANIETNLEFGDGDDAWALRARNALAYHKYVDTLIGRRLKTLRAKTGSPFGAAAKAATKPRERKECADLTWDAIDGKIPDPEQPDTVEKMEAVAALLRAQIDAILADRLDETVSYVQTAWDTAWLKTSSEALRKAKAALLRLNQRITAERRAAKIAARQIIEADRAQRFIYAAREMLGPATFAALWAEVDRATAAEQPAPEAR